MHFISGKQLDRRTFLRGAGVSLALPFMDAMVPAGRAWRDPAEGFVRFIGIEESHGCAGGNDWGDLQHLFAPATIGRDFEIGPESQLRAVEEERESALQEFRSRETQTASRLDELESDEARMTSLIDELDERRRAMEAARTRTGGAAITTADEGQLDWPLDGRLIYRFGRERRRVVDRVRAIADRVRPR